MSNKPQFDEARFRLALDVAITKLDTAVREASDTLALLKDLDSEIAKGSNDRFKPGDPVAWNCAGMPTVGIVVRKDPAGPYYDVRSRRGTLHSVPERSLQ